MTQLPVSYLYSPSHYWLAQQPSGRWRVGITKFASRMLGEMVDHGFDIKLGDDVKPGQTLGWLEGFKAITDVYCVVEGKFSGLNPALGSEIELVNKDCYGGGWLYEAEGSPDSRCMDVQAYWTLLDKTIDRILEKQKQEEES